MNREEAVQALQDQSTTWDFLIIGGGASGLGCAVDAASRGHRVLLVEGADFAKGTSSRSTKLVHGGVRYLKQGNISLVLEALKERGLLCRNAPHLAHHLSFIVPTYTWWEGPFYGIGMKVYDRMAGRMGLNPSRILSREETLQRLPNLEPEGLQRGVLYYDGQFDDSRLAVNLAQTAHEHGAYLLNYAPVRSLSVQHGVVSGAEVEDLETGRHYLVKARCVINATGVFTDSIRAMEDPATTPIISASRGVHIVLPKDFLAGESAIMVPHTTDGRVLFAVPWHNHVVVGTTDTATRDIDIEPVSSSDEIGFILSNASRYLQRDPSESDILSVFAGLRPLVSHEGSKSTATLSRDHTLMVSPSGLVTITGGKWTTYRKMAQDTIYQAEIVADLDSTSCQTEELPIHGSSGPLPDSTVSHFWYGSDREPLLELCRSLPDGEQLLHPALPYLIGEIHWAVKHEMARTIEDVLARRTRALFLNAQAAIEAAPVVARHMAQLLGRDSQWEAHQVTDFKYLALQYQI